MIESSKWWKERREISNKKEEEGIYNVLDKHITTPPGIIVYTPRIVIVYM